MSTLTPKQRSDIKASQADQPAASLTSALRATLASSTQGAAATIALAAVQAAGTPLASAASVTAASVTAAAATAALGVSLAASIATKQNTLQVAVLEQQALSGVAGGAAATVAVRPLALISNTITGASASRSGISLPAGTYFVTAYGVASGVGLHQCHVSYGADLQGSSALAPVGSASVSQASGLITLAAVTVVELHHLMQTPAGTSDGGAPGSLGVEVYAQLLIWRLS